MGEGVRKCYLLSQKYIWIGSSSEQRLQNGCGGKLNSVEDGCVSILRQSQHRQSTEKEEEERRQGKARQGKQTDLALFTSTLGILVFNNKATVCRSPFCVANMSRV
jgi:hypothetical protein